jgi:tRNA (guanine37-N1)-methyltransferase
MKIAIISIFPEMFEALQKGMPGIAVEKKALALFFFNPRDYTEDVYRRVDDRPYGGGPGMVMMAEPLAKAIEAAKEILPQAEVIYLSPQGETLHQTQIKTLSATEELILLCGRYEGIDERILEVFVEKEYSMGDFILSGGEIPAMALIDACARLLPNVLENPASIVHESFEKDLLDFPHYTKPREFQGLAVPEVLLGGNHQAIADFRAAKSLENTQKKRPDLLRK